MKEIKVKATFIDEVLGTVPGDRDIYENHVAPDYPDDAEKLPKPENLTEAVDKGTTFFYQDADGNPIMRAYQVKGFFKDSASALSRVKKTAKQPGSVSSGVKAYKKIIDGLIFITEDDIPLQLQDGAELGYCERPLRAQTAQGERVSLARSQSAPAGTVIEFTIQMFDAGLEKWVRELLDYGRFRGFLQWRNSGKGRFTWEEVTE